jgi:hypothetical protein
MKAMFVIPVKSARFGENFERRLMWNARLGHVAHDNDFVWPQIKKVPVRSGTLDQASLQSKTLRISRKHIYLPRNHISTYNW